MSFDYPEVPLGSANYSALAGLDFASEYLAADPNAAKWLALTEDDQAKTIVAGTRVLDRVAWAGSPAEADQEHAWPRINVTANGVAVDSTIIPTAIAQACCELAMAQANGTDIANAPGTETLVKSRRAGSVGIEYFRQPEGDALPMPRPAWQLIAPYLGGTGMASGSVFTGDPCARSQTYESFRFTDGI